MKRVLRIGKKSIDFFGYVLPNIAFITIFVTFIFTIVSRYVLRIPIAWSYEVSILAYMWVMFFGVGKAMEADEHVVFGLVYDALTPRRQCIMKIVYNCILVLLLAITFVPSIQSLMSKKMVTGVLKMPYKIVFAPFIYMFFEIIFRALNDIWKNVQKIKCGEKKKVEVE